MVRAREGNEERSEEEVKVARARVLPEGHVKKLPAPGAGVVVTECPAPSIYTTLLHSYVTVAAMGVPGGGDKMAAVGNGVQDQSHRR